MLESRVECTRRTSHIANRRELPLQVRGIGPPVEQEEQIGNIQRVGLPHAYRLFRASANRT